jgi:hypothetical protein
MGIEPLRSSISRYSAEIVSRDGKTETFKGGRDKGHRREMELTIEAMERGRDAPIPFAELIEVTEATFAVEEALKTQRTVRLDAWAGDSSAAR